MTDDSEERILEPLEGLGPLDLGDSWGGRAREYIDQARERLYEEHKAGASGHTIVRRYTAVIDFVIQNLFVAARSEYRERYALVDRHCTLAAQGGYGRAELNPHSDIDLLFLYPHRRDAFVETVTERILYALWDTGMDVGYATRNLRECVNLAARDFKVKTSLLDTRFIAGDAALYADFVRSMERDVLKRGASRFFREKIAENDERHGRYGDSVYLVQPQLKEGEGGLRDLHTAMWLAKVKFKTNSVEELVWKGVLNTRDQTEIEAARDFLFRVRNSLHFMTGQHQDHFTFDLQEQVARQLGYEDDGSIRAVQQLMRDYYLHAATINRFSNEMIARCVESPRPVQMFRRLGGRQLRPGVRIVGNELVVGDPTVFRDQPELLLRVFADSQRYGAPLSPDTRRAVREHAHLIDERQRSRVEVVEAFKDVLRWKVDVYSTLVEMHKLDVLGAILPEFGRLRCMPQYDMFHIYTVDEHTLRGIQAMERLRRGDFKDSIPLLTDVVRGIDNVEILYLGMLLHDIGKGLGGNHSNRGAGMIAEIAERLFLNSDERDQIELLVREHLEMSHRATRRDVHDPKLVLDFARRVGSLDNLNRLYVLTFADMSAVNPRVWNSWHDTLLRELYFNTAAALEHGLARVPDATARAARVRERVAAAVGERGGRSLEGFLIDFPDRYFLSTPERDIPRHFEYARSFEEESLVIRTEHFSELEYTELTVITRDRPGLFYQVVGVLRAAGMSIVDARVTTSRSGTVLDVLRIGHEGQPEAVCDARRWERIRITLQDVIERGRDVEGLIAAAQRPSILDRQPRRPRIRTDVQFDNRSSESFTVVDIHARDRLGVLFSIARTFFQLRLSVHLARITTSADQVLDVFYLTERDGTKITDPGRLEDIRVRLLEAIQAVERGRGEDTPPPAVAAG